MHLLQSEGNRTQLTEGGPYFRAPTSPSTSTCSATSKNMAAWLPRPRHLSMSLTIKPLTSPFLLAPRRHPVAREGTAFREAGTDTSGRRGFGPLTAPRSGFEGSRSLISEGTQAGSTRSSITEPSRPAPARPPWVVVSKPS